jgi:hypothetical protein
VNLSRVRSYSTFNTSVEHGDVNHERVEQYGLEVSSFDCCRCGVGSLRWTSDARSELTGTGATVVTKATIRSATIEAANVTATGAAAGTKTRGSCFDAGRSLSATTAGLAGTITASGSGCSIRAAGSAQRGTGRHGYGIEWGSFRRSDRPHTSHGAVSGGSL